MQSSDASKQQIQTVVKECFEQVRIARAAELARCGHFLEAEALLSPNGQPPSDPTELDLLARICAQQKQYDRASRFWTIALEISPKNAAGYEQAIQRAYKTKKLQHLRRSAVCAILAVVVVGSVLAFSRDVLRHLGLSARNSPNFVEVPATANALPPSPTLPALPNDQEIPSGGVPIPVSAADATPRVEPPNAGAVAPRPLRP